jgi:RNA polymerase sigma-70 factor (sigma-E family)
MDDSRSAFEQFVAAEATALLRFAVLVTSDQHVAEDLTQTVLEALYRRWCRHGAPDDPPTYARSALVNAARRSWRLRSRLQERPVATLPESATTDDLRDVVLRRQLLAALSTLPTQQRAVLALRYFEDRSEAETAALLGCRIGTVKSHASRGLRRLRNSPDLLAHLDPAMET